MHRFSHQELKEATGSLFVDEIQVRFQDVDAAGVVFFARVFDYLHGAYEGLLESAGLPLAQVLATRAWLAPLRHAEADYLAPLRFGDTVSVHVALAHLEEFQVVFGYRLLKQDGSLVALGQTVHAFLEVDTWKKRPVPSELVSFLDALR